MLRTLLFAVDYLYMVRNECECLDVVLYYVSVKPTETMCVLVFGFCKNAFRL